MELLLMRHSITPGNLARRFVGSSDQPLAPEGEALARKTAPLLEPVEHLYRSPMLRCRQTAELLWPGVETTVIDDLRETDFGPLEGMDNSQAKQTELYRRWSRGEIGPGEAVEDSRPRAIQAIRTIGRDAAEQGWRKVAVVAHGGLFMGLLAQYGRPDRSYYDWLLPNCGGYRVTLAIDTQIQEIVEDTLDTWTSWPSLRDPSDKV